MSDLPLIEQNRRDVAFMVALNLMLGYFMIIHPLILKSSSGAPSFSLEFFSTITECTAVITMTGIISILLSGVISTENKRRIAVLPLYLFPFTKSNRYWICLKQPGCWAFTDLMIDEDFRIGSELAKIQLAKYKSIPIGKEQNKIWYALYTQHQEKPSVIQANKSYLLTMEMLAVTTLITLPFLYIYLFFHYDLLHQGLDSSAMDNSIAIYSSIMMAQYLLLSIATRTYGENLVKNVLAVGTTSEGNFPQSRIRVDNINERQRRHFLYKKI